MRNPRARLVALLGEAEAALGSPALGDSPWSELSLSDFRKLVSDARSAMERGDLSDAAAADLWRAFAPTCDWDDIGGEPDLGHAIFELIDSLYGPPPPPG